MQDMEPQRINAENLSTEELLDESKGIPVDEVKRAYDFFPYGSPERLMLAIRFITGCRGSELDNMKPQLILGGVLYWPLGKKQRTFRRISLPEWLLKEIMQMRANYSCSSNKLFPISNESFRRYFNKNRDEIGGGWVKKCIRIRNGRPNLEYRYSLSGLRKDYQTILFKNKLDEWGDAHVALQFTQKEMKHKSDKVTAYHYIENFNILGPTTINYRNLPNILQDRVQKRIIDY